MEWRLKGMFATLQKMRRPLDGWDIRSTNNFRLILNPAFLTQKNRVKFYNTIKHFNLEGNQGKNESFIISSPKHIPIGAKPIFDARRDKEHHSIYLNKLMRIMQILLSGKFVPSESCRRYQINGWVISSK